MARVLLGSVMQPLLSPAAIACFKESVSSEAVRQFAGIHDEDKRQAKRLDDVAVQVERLINFIKAGIDPSIVREELNRLQAERDILGYEQAQARSAAPWSRM